jgi:hypothetical protein
MSFHDYGCYFAALQGLTCLILVQIYCYLMVL